MTMPSVYLIRIYHDRDYGFRVVAVVAENEEEAKAWCAKKYNADFSKQWEATIEDECGTDRLGAYATFTFEE